MKKAEFLSIFLATAICSTPAYAKQGASAVVGHLHGHS
ncbi:hypothetical protein MNBD_ALPHA04-651 [hydrothermal vent metagenome]|uniref:Uncharacterized protein n=1 Tax=hydrothermal vent metagenome TaxID=652676 RepID=A0A3B0SPR4_9ZZZZ